MIFESLFRRVALQDHWCVEDELPTALVIPPDATPLRERRCTSEEATQCGQSLGDPVLLIDSLLVTVDASVVRPTDVYLSRTFAQTFPTVILSGAKDLEVGALLLPPRSFAPLRMTVGKGEDLRSLG